MDRKTRLEMLRDFKKLPYDQFITKYPAPILKDFFTAQQAALERQAAGRHGQLTRLNRTIKERDTKIKSFE